MKKILLACALLGAAVANATTYVPVQLLNPAGSSSGQTIVSNGSSSAPTWGNVSTAALTGILPVANGGTNAGSASGTALDNISGFSGTGFLTRTGAGAYAFQSATNGITLGNLAQAAANTVLANGTGSTANLTAFSMPSCSTSASALNWTTGTGFTCGTVASSGANSNITSLSGLTTALSVAQGGTGRATLTTHGVLIGEGTAAINQLAVGTTGQMLLGATGADPAFGNNPTITGGTIDGACFGCTTSAAVFSTSLSHSQQEVDKSYTVTTPTTGQTVTLASGTETAIITPAGTLASLTITLPACNSAYDGSIARFVSFQTITSLTVNATSGTVVNGPTSAAIAVGHAFLCRQAATAWYPLY